MNCIDRAKLDFAQFSAISGRGGHAEARNLRQLAWCIAPTFGGDSARLAGFLAAPGLLQAGHAQAVHHRL
jgi:hypothetical protein